jgi:membrane associated rhomboid family serine protease
MDIPLHEESLDPRAQAQRDRRRFWIAALISAGFVALLWWIRMLEVGLGHSLAALGVRPGEWSGLIGVLAGPLIHGSTKHLVANSLPMLVLGTLTLAVYPRTAPRAIVAIWLLSGLGIWFFGRPSVHIGASGLSHGLMFLLFVLGLLRRDRAGIAAALIAFFLYGGMLLTVLPGDPQISWEAHLFGAVSGALAALLWRRRDPAARRRRYSWEDEDAAIEPLHDGLAAQDRATFEPPPPQTVPVLWRRVEPPGGSAVVLPFRTRTESDPETRH